MNEIRNPRETENKSGYVLETPFNVFNHQARLPNLRIAHHPYFQNDGIAIRCDYSVPQTKFSQSIGKD